MKTELLEIDRLAQHAEMQEPPMSANEFLRPWCYRAVIAGSVFVIACGIYLWWKG